MAFLLSILFFWLALSFLLGLIAAGFGRSGFGFFFLSLVVSPLLAGLILLAKGKKPAPVGSTVVKVRCPECGGTVKESAQFCADCGAELPAPQKRTKQQSRNSAAAGSTTRSKKLSALGLTYWVILLSFGGGIGAISAQGFSAEFSGLGALVGLVVSGIAGVVTQKKFPEQMTKYGS